MRSLVFVALLCAPSLSGQTLTLLPVADATTDQSQPATNLGADPELGFGKVRGSSGPYFLRGHVEFDLAPVVATGRLPMRATFHWYQSRSNAAGCLDVTLHRVLASWSESAITWQNQPQHDPIVDGRACVGDSFANGWKTFDVTPLVQGWTSGLSNFGLVVRDPTESPSGAARPGYGHSRENGDPALVPFLEVEFAERFGSGCSSRALIPELDVLRGRPQLGSFLTVRTTNVVSGSFPGMVFGLSNTTWNGNSLPLSLAQYGLPGCDLLVAPDWSGTLLALGNTQWDLTFLWPNDPSLDGVTLYMQSALQPPAAAPELTNGIGVTLWQ